VDDNDDLYWNEKVSAIKDAFLKEHEDIPLIYLANHPNQGSANARNIGIAAANGVYITFLDDDDLYLPEKIQHQVTFMQEGEYDYSITDLYLYNADENIVDRRIRKYIQKTTQDALQRYHLLYHLTGTDTMMFQKSYLLQIGCFAPIDVGDEYYLMQRAIEGGGRFGYFPGCDVKAYVHTGDGGLSSGQGKINGENVLYSYKKQFFSNIEAKDRRFITMRHYAVVAFAQLRSRRYFAFAKNAALSFASSPVQCICLLIDRSCL
jgi:glycosyltransferase involved in cell wall biosynthesis